MSDRVIQALFELAHEAIAANDNEGFFNLVRFLELLGQDISELKRAWYETD